MKTIYISSTCSDLKKYRAAVAKTLNDSGYVVDAMEKYAARDKRPKAACEADVSRSDIYVGLFGWKYGHIPDEENPERKSITELEYLAAAKKPRLVFLLDKKAAETAAMKGAKGQDDDLLQVRRLRDALLKEKWLGSFKSPDELAKKVLTSVIQFESLKKAETIEAFGQINDAAVLVSSYLPNIELQMATLEAAEFVAIRLGPIPWWDTRLYLVASLASDFTRIRQLILLDAEGKFLTMASPAEIQRALAKSCPLAALAYFQTRQKSPNAVNQIVWMYPEQMNSPPSGQIEIDVKQVITPINLRELGIRADGDEMEEFIDRRQSELYSDALHRNLPFVVVMRGNELIGVIDRMELA